MNRAIGSPTSTECFKFTLKRIFLESIERSEKEYKGKMTGEKSFHATKHIIWPVAKFLYVPTN